MLKKILSISGKPGLYKLVSQGKNMLIVESLADGKRIPSFSKDKVVSLADIAIFTDAGEVKLAEVLEKIKIHENGATSQVDSKADNIALRKYMGEVLPDYDRDRVYPSDIRKLISWYNILVSNDITDFSDETGEEGSTTEKPEKTQE